MLKVEQFRETPQKVAFPIGFPLNQAEKKYPPRKHGQVFFEAAVVSPLGLTLVDLAPMRAQGRVVGRTNDTGEELWRVALRRKKAAEFRFLQILMLAGAH